MKGLMAKNNLKRICPTCQKKRIPRLFPKGARSCDLCKIAKRNGLKREKREAGVKVWIKRLDAIVGTQVRQREGVCASPRIHNCKMNWQWCHGFSRSYHSTRWDLDNGFKMCAAEHKYFTHHPLEWETFLEETWGVEGFRERRAKALASITDKSYYKTLFESLKEESVCKKIA